MATIKTYNKGECLPLDGDDLQAITTLAVTCLKEHKGIPAKYPNTPQGLADFMQRSQEFFAYCNDINADGFVLYSYEYLDGSQTQEEMKNYRSVIN